MAINIYSTTVIVQDNGGFLPDLTLLTLSYRLLTLSYRLFVLTVYL